jgi:hypothetical protein
MRPGPQVTSTTRLNSAPPQVVAGSSEIPVAVAVLIADAHAAAITFTTVDGLFSCTDIPVSALGSRPRARARHGRRIRQSSAPARINGSRSRLHS